MNGKLTIITGIAGTGKSEKARRIRQFNPENTIIIDEAERNWLKVELGLESGKHVVAVIRTVSGAKHIDIEHDTYEEYMHERDNEE